MGPDRARPVPEVGGTPSPPGEAAVEAGRAAHAAPVGDDARVAVLLPVALGLAVLSLGAFVPVAVTALAGFAAAGAAGFLRPEAPVRSGALVFAPTAVLSVAAAWAVPVGAPALLFGLVSGLMVALVASHLGAGLAVRRQEGPGR